MLNDKERTRNQLNYFKWFLVILIGTFFVKCLVASIMPLTGDEAYYAIWGQVFQWGYYDHTPLIGWLLHPFVAVSTSNFSLRLLPILTTTISGVFIYYLLKSYDKEKAALVSVLYLISPVNLLGMIITTDIPVIFFSFLSGICLFLAFKKNDNLFYYLLSGLFLGLAFFSKYFAVLLALAYVIVFFSMQKNKKRTLGFILIFLCVLPFGLENLYWNYMHGWANIQFNIYHRNESMRFNWQTLLLYPLILFYIVTPPIFNYLIKQGKKVFGLQLSEFNIFVILFLVPFLFFLVLSAFKSIGLHWPLAFVAFTYLVLIALLSTTELLRSIKFMAFFSGLHLLLLLTILLLPVQSFKTFHWHGKRYADIVFFFKHSGIRQYLNQYNQNFILASPSYSKADLMTLDSGVYSPTFGHGSVHGREGDFLTDYRTYAKKNFVIFDTKEPDLNDYLPYFKRVYVETFLYKDATFYLVFGYQFNYVRYRDTILKLINERYWQVPNYLPHSEVFYCKRYFNSKYCLTS